MCAVSCVCARRRGEHPDRASSETICRALSRAFALRVCAGPPLAIPPWRDVRGASLSTSSAVAFFWRGGATEREHACLPPALPLSHTTTTKAWTTTTGIDMRIAGIRQAFA